MYGLVERLTLVTLFHFL